MTSQENTALIEKIYQEFESSDPPKFRALMDYLDDNVIWEVPGPKGLLPFVGIYNGKEQVKEFFTKINQVLDIHNYSHEKIVAQNDDVVVIGSDDATVRVTGETYKNKWCHVFTLKDGKIVKFYQWYNLHTVMRAAIG